MACTAVFSVLSPVSRYGPARSENPAARNPDWKLPVGMLVNPPTTPCRMALPSVLLAKSRTSEPRSKLPVFKSPTSKNAAACAALSNTPWILPDCAPPAAAPVTAEEVKPASPALNPSDDSKTPASQGWVAAMRTGAKNWNGPDSQKQPRKQYPLGSVNLSGLLPT